MSINLENAEVDFSFTQQQQQQHGNTHEVAADVVLENPMDIFAKLLPLMQQQQLATINQLGTSFNSALEKFADKIEGRLVNVLSSSSKESQQHGDISPGNLSNTGHIRDNSLGHGHQHREISLDHNSVHTETSGNSGEALYQGTWEDLNKHARKRKLPSCTLTSTSKRRSTANESNHPPTPDDVLSIAASGRIDDSKSKPTLDCQQDLWADVNGEFNDNEFGPELPPPLTSSVKVMFTKKLGADKIKAKLEATKIPANCKFMGVKPCNFPIWSRPDQTRQNDVNLQKIQTSMSKANVHLLHLTEELMESSKLSKDGFVRVDSNMLLGFARDALVLAGNAYQQLNQYKRDSLELSKSMRLLAKDVPEDDKMLFGDDLDKRISVVQASEKTTLVLSKSAQNDRKPPSSSSNRYTNNKPFYSQTQSSWQSKNLKSSSKNYPQKRTNKQRPQGVPQKKNYKENNKPHH